MMLCKRFNEKKKDVGGSLCQSNTDGTGKGSKRIRQWERMDRKVQCKQKTPLPWFRLTLVFKDVGQKAIASGKALSWRPAEHARRVLQPLSLQLKWGTKPQSDGVGLQIQDLDHPESWVWWVPRSREGPQALSPHGDSRAAGMEYCWMLGWTLPTQASCQSWSLAKQTWMGCYQSVSAPEQLALGTCGCWWPECEPSPVEGQDAPQGSDPEEGQLWVLAEAKLVLHKLSGGSGWPV